jgi:hypothetical protein
MIKVDDIRTGFQAEEALKRSSIYRDKSRYDTSYIQLYIAQRKIYNRLYDKIRDDNIRETLNELEKILLK